VTETFNPTEWVTTKEAAELTGHTMARFRQQAKAETAEAEKRGTNGCLRKASAQESADRMKQLEAAKHDPPREWKAESH